MTEIYTFAFNELQIKLHDAERYFLGWEVAQPFPIGTYHIVKPSMRIMKKRLPLHSDAGSLNRCAETARGATPQ